MYRLKVLNILLQLIIHSIQFDMAIHILTQEYGLWDSDDNRNIESFVLKIRTYKEKDNGKLLLDLLPRTALGYAFKIEIVSALFMMLETYYLFPIY